MISSKGVQRAAQSAHKKAEVPVWDLFVRLFHWSLVTTFFLSWVTAESWDSVHDRAGYAAATLVLLRSSWGLFGPQYARFSNFVYGPLFVARYLNDMVHGREGRYLGHNPAGGVMILALLTGVIGLAITGYMMGTDTYWGIKWVEDLHEALANGMLVLIGLHIVGVIFASVRHNENLVKAMVTGKKSLRGNEPSE